MTRKREPSAIVIDGDIAYVKLTLGFEAVVDAEAVSLVSGKSWRLLRPSPDHLYAVYQEKNQAILMHRLLTQAPKGMAVDHIDGDGLNNRKSNMRVCTYGENNANSIANSRNALQKKGVTLGVTGKFEARVFKEGKCYYIGSFDTADEASAAYFGAAKILWGEFAKR